MNNTPATGDTPNSRPETVAPHVIPESLKSQGDTPALPRFRRLQGGALLLAIIWLLLGLVASQKLITAAIASDLERLLSKAQSEARFISQIVEKGLKTAQQLSLTLAQDTDTLQLTREMNERAAVLKKMTFAERFEFLKNYPLTQKMNSNYARICQDAELLAVFTLDANGYCIASSDFNLATQDLNCLASNYSSRFYFQSAKDSGQGRQFAVGKRVPIPSFFFATRTRINGEFGGTVVTRLDALKLTSDLRSLPTVSWVIDRRGVVVSSNEDALLFNYLENAHREAPNELILKTVYAQKNLATLPLSRQTDFPQQWPVWLLKNEPVVLAFSEVGATEFQLWHAFPVAEVLAKHNHAWYLASAIIVLGLLIILLTERMVDFHQRRVASLATLSRVNRSLEDATKQLYTIATTDHLTQLFTRGYFIQRLEEELKRAKREKTQLALLELDIDDFKSINDTYGHPAGDAAIRHMSDHCRNVVRASDIIGRIGGEEFAIALPNCIENSAMEIAENIRNACATIPLHYQGHEISFTCSVGVTLLGNKTNVEELLNVVDQALYRAKNAGRNKAELL
ncbi:diguanylate cyclase (GGDEF)-like protein [Alteromonadaceae bacterium 2753L.S.0a.02]|nr:diguanylate cyclase (GGDEF)-like protein [Alteromonadaceae bacterium 2753L.S.0a.02]